MNKIDLNQVFNEVEIESEYLKNLLYNILGIIGRSVNLKDLNLGPIKEKPTSSGEIAEITGNGHIIIDSKRLKELDQPVAMAIIAHEIAHSYLEHYLNATRGAGLRNEREADNQAREWGFDVDYFRKVLGPPHIAEQFR